MIKMLTATHAIVRTDAITAEIVYHNDGPPQLVLLSSNGSIILTEDKNIDQFFSALEDLSEEWTSAHLADPPL
jgi:hypothetical protein